MAGDDRDRRARHTVAHVRDLRTLFAVGAPQPPLSTRCAHASATAGPDQGSTDAFGACVLGHQRLAGPRPGARLPARRERDRQTSSPSSTASSTTSPELRAELAARGHEVRGRGDTPVIPHLYEEYGTAVRRAARGHVRDRAVGRGRAGGSSSRATGSGRSRSSGRGSTTGRIAFASELKAFHGAPRLRLASPISPRSTRTSRCSTSRARAPGIRGVQRLGARLAPRRRGRVGDRSSATGSPRVADDMPRTRRLARARARERRRRRAQPARRRRPPRCAALGRHRLGHRRRARWRRRRPSRCARSRSASPTSATTSGDSRARWPSATVDPPRRDRARARRRRDAAAPRRRLRRAARGRGGAAALPHLRSRAPGGDGRARRRRRRRVVRRLRALRGDGPRRPGARPRRRPPARGCCAALPSGRAERRSTPSEPRASSRPRPCPRAERYGRLMEVFSLSERAELWTDEARAEIGALVSPGFLLGAPAGARHRRAAACSTSRPICPGDLLPKSDIASMAHSLELRSPLLDHRVVELGLSLPDSLKRRGREGKVALRRAFADDLPPLVAGRGKSGFGVPLAAWFRGELRPLAPRAPARRACAVARLVPRRRPSSGCSTSTRQARADNGHRLWALVMLELWQRAHVDADAPRACRGRRGDRRLAYVAVAVLSRATAPRRAAARARRDPRRAHARRATSSRSSFVEHGTFGFIPGEPSAYTQPLYGWFLVPDLLDLRPPLAADRARADRPRGRDRAGSSTRSAGAFSARAPGSSPPRSRRSTRTSCGTTCTSTARSSTSSCAAALVLAHARRSRSGRRCGVGALLGVVYGLAMLGNTRLVALPILCAGYLALRLPRARSTAVIAGLVLAGAAVAVAPWLVRNKVQRRLLGDHHRRPRALEGEQPTDLSRCSRHGQWIDNVALPAAAARPGTSRRTRRAASSRAARARSAPTRTSASQMRFYEHLALEYWTRPSRATRRSSPRCRSSCSGSRT